MNESLQTTNNQEQLLTHLRQVSTLLDSRFSVAGFRFGIDGLIGLIPGLGDTAGGLVSIYIVLRAYRAGLSSELTNKMLLRIITDVFIGSVPLLGDVFDFFYKVNNRNLKDIETYFTQSA